MRPQGPTFWLLERDYFGNPNNTLKRVGVSVGAAGIELAATGADSPVGLNSPDGSLGGLVLPPRIALDREYSIYLLSAVQPVIRKLDVHARSFVDLPALGGEGSEARQFHDPAAIAIAGNDLFVADRGNARVQVFALGSLALRHVWDLPVVDVTAAGGAAYLLDAAHARVYRVRAGSDTPRLVVDVPAAAGKWNRVAVDRQGRIYVLKAGPELVIFDAQGHKLGTAAQAGDVRDRFPAPPIRVDYKGRFCVPDSMLRECGRDATSVPNRDPSGAVPPCSGQLFDLEGRPARRVPGESPGPRIYQKEGTWISGPLDSQIYRCQWHRIVLQAASLPPGSNFSVSTYSDAQLRPLAEIELAPEELWTTRYRATGAMQERMPGPEKREFLVQSREGRYLWLRFQLGGDGYGTPVVDSIRVEYPRDSWLQYLPAVYTADEESRRFLERFLSVFQTTWDQLDTRISEIARYFDPAAVPAGAFMDYLAAWLALPLEATWTAGQKRRLLMAAPRIYPKIGKPDGVREYLRVYLENMTGVIAPGDDAYPQILEGFRERDHLMLSVGGVGGLAAGGHGAPLWGPAQIGRLQLDVFSTTGEVSLISTGDPERDVFHHYAHRFRVFFPAGWLRTADDERMVRRAIDAVKPAHTAYDLCLVEPRYRVGIQSTVGVDTIIGGYPAMRLGCRDASDLPPSRLPGNLLGYDTILGMRAEAAPALHLAPAARVGVDTILN